MSMRRRQTSYSSVTSAEDYAGAYEQNVRFPKQPEENYYTDPESRGIHSMNSSRIRKTSYFGVLFIILQIAVLCVVSFFAYMSYTDLKDTTSQLTLLSEEYTSLRDSYTVTESELMEAGEVFAMVRKKMGSIFPESSMSSQRGVDGSRVLFDSIIKRQEAQSKRINDLQRSIQESDRKQLEEKYGPGPYKIEVTLLVGNVNKYFTIETAPNHLVPHSIRKFMELIESHTYANTPLVATGHIILTTLPKETVEDNFKQLSFPEYSPNFPHIANTVGFATRPGGPEFYINIDNNSKLHGPGGQKHHALVEEADACFGKIVRGLDLVAEIQKGKRAVIRKMTLLKQKS